VAMAIASLASRPPLPFRARGRRCDTAYMEDRDDYGAGKLDADLECVSCDTGIESCYAPDDDRHGRRDGVKGQRPSSVKAACEAGRVDAHFIGAAGYGVAGWLLVGSSVPLLPLS
jgi:hypothetical protein